METSASAVSVEVALAGMQQQVRLGQLEEAERLGASCAVPLAVPLSRLVFLGELASGAEATVLQARYDGAPVAVKRFKIAQRDDLDRYRRELSVMAALRGCHPHIMPVLAARALPPSYLLVMPLAQSNLHAALYEQGWQPAWREVLQIGADVAGALEFVHACGIVHRDIKPGNLMLFPGGHVKVSDFGIAATVEEAAAQVEVTAASVRARGKPTGGFHKRSIVGTLEYMAPEVLLKRPHTLAADVYAFGVTLNQLATGVYPFSDCTKDKAEVHTVLEMGYGRQELATAVAAAGLRPTPPSAAPPGFAQLLSACWAHDPHARPGFAAVRAALAEMLQRLPEWEASAAAAAAAAAAACTEQREGEALLVGASGDDPMEGTSDGSELLRYPFGGGGQRAMDWDVLMGASTTCSDQDETWGLPRLGGLGTAAAATWGPPPPKHPHAIAAGGAGGGASFRRRSADGGGVAAARRRSADAAGTPRTTEGADRGVVGGGGAGAHLQAGVYSDPGPRETMEDRHALVQGFAGDPAALFASVFDGHRGFEAAEFAAAHLPRMAATRVARGAPPARALASAFAEVDGAFWREWQQEQRAKAARGRMAERFPGCTALAVLVAGGTVLAANVGDSHAVLCRGGAPLPLSRPHTAADASERARVAAAGGAVAWRGAGAGGWRVGPAALQVTRALGDFDSKSALPFGGSGGGGGVVSEPEIFEIGLVPEDEFLVIATDGLWDVVSEREAVGLVADTVKQPELAAKRLAVEALARGSGDNVTVVVVFLRQQASLQVVFGGACGRAPPPAATATVFGTRR